MGQPDAKREEALRDLEFLLAQPKLSTWGMDSLIDTLRVLIPELDTIVDKPQKC